VRLHVTGRCAERRAVVQRLAEPFRGASREDALSFFVESVVDRTRTPHDLADLARQRHGAAAVARRLIALEGGDAVERARLLEGARARLRQLRDKAWVAALDVPEPDDDELARELASQGYDLLDELAGAERRS
jgi:hypothetical protein